MIKPTLALFFILVNIFCKAQNTVNLNAYNKKSEAKISVNDNVLTVSCPVGKNDFGKLLLDLSIDKPLFKSIQLKKNG